MTLQLFSPLPRDIEDALRTSIQRFGVLVPVVRDQNGRTLDGHHRSRIADELGVKYRVDEVTVADDDEAREVARTLNADRRHLTPEQRRSVVLVLASETVAAGKGGREEVARHSERAIAGALGVSQDTVQRDMKELTDVGQLARPAKTLGRDEKVRRSTSMPEEIPASKPIGRPRKPPANRRPLPAFAKDTGWALRKQAETIERIASDDRLDTYKEQVTAHLHGHLTYTIQACQSLLNRLTQTEGD